jgi:serine/threonine-protein kinase
MIGTTAGKYRIIGQLGRGATGIVYKAVDETLGREVAVKVLNGGLAETDILKRFRAEATTLARLNHPEIATIYELFHWETQFLMVMELVRGETLEQLSTRVGPLPPPRAAYLSDRILSALEHAHRAGVVHRDMKPANVMVTDAGGVKIMDFGVARVRGAEHMTMDGHVVGTPAYMAPEQVLAHEVDGRADLYSVGVVFYRLLTGALPFEADSPVGMLHRQIAELPTPLSEHRDDVPEWCETIVQRALAKSPADRFQTAGEFREALGCATHIVTTTDVANDSARDNSQVSAAPAPLSTLVISPSEAGLRTPGSATDIRSLPTTLLRTNTPLPGAVWTRAVSAADQLWRSLPKTYRAKTGSILAIFAVSVGMVAYVALDKAETAPERRVVTSLPVAKPFPALVFRTKALVGVGSRLRERDARLVLAERTVTVAADDDTGDRLYAVACESVLSIDYSRGADPMWNGPHGPAVVARAPVGTLRQLGISVERHWISLRTNTENRFIILRVDESQVRRMLSMLEERTGRAPQVVAQRKRTRR